MLRRKPPELPSARSGSGPPDARFWFNFLHEKNAQASAAELQRKGYAAKVIPPGPPQTWTWGVLAGGIPETDDLEAAEKIFKKWAKSNGGDYDAPEVAVATDATGERRSFSVAVTDDAADAEPTSVMRHSEFPFWVSLRQRLAQEGIDHSTTRLVESFEEGPTRPADFDAEEVGVLLTADGRLLEYRYSFAREAWDNWTDITDTWRTGRHAQVIERALKQSM